MQAQITMMIWQPRLLKSPKNQSKVSATTLKLTLSMKKMPKSVLHSFRKKEKSPQMITLSPMIKWTAFLAALWRRKSKNKLNTSSSKNNQPGSKRFNKSSFLHSNKPRWFLYKFANSLNQFFSSKSSSSLNKESFRRRSLSSQHCKIFKTYSKINQS